LTGQNALQHELFTPSVLISSSKPLKQFDFRIVDKLPLVVVDKLPLTLFLVQTFVWCTQMQSQLLGYVSKGC